MDFLGRISRVQPVRSGTSQRGEWKTLPFIFEYFETDEQRWPDRVLLETMDTNIMDQIGAYLKKDADGKTVVENGECVLLSELKCCIGFSHNVREYNKPDGTKARYNYEPIYKFEMLGEQQPAGQQAPPQAQPTAAPIPQQPAEESQADDLPF